MLVLACSCRFVACLKKKVGRQNGPLCAGKKCLSVRQTLCPFLPGWQLDGSQRSATLHWSHLPALLYCYNKDANTSASRFNTDHYFTSVTVLSVQYPSNSNQTHGNESVWWSLWVRLIRALFSFVMHPSLLWALQHSLLVSLVPA